MTRPTSKYAEAGSLAGEHQFEEKQPQEGCSMLTFTTLNPALRAKRLTFASMSSQSSNVFPWYISREMILISPSGPVYARPDPGSEPTSNVTSSSPTCCSSVVLGVSCGGAGDINAFPTGGFMTSAKTKPSPRIPNPVLRYCLLASPAVPAKVLSAPPSHGQTLDFPVRRGPDSRETLSMIISIENLPWKRRGVMNITTVSTSV